MTTMQNNITCDVEILKKGNGSSNEASTLIATNINNLKQSENDIRQKLRARQQTL